MVEHHPDIPLTLDEIEVAHDALLLQRDGLTSPLDGAPELWNDVVLFMAQLRHGGILLDRPRDRRVAQGLLDYWASALIRAGQPLPELQLEAFDETKAPILRGKTPCPYQGLEAFTEERGDYFFGRESLLDNIVQRTRAGQSHFLVSGASGSGKSSLLRAGLVPRLRRGGDIQGSEGWCYVTMVPGDDPMHSLDEALRGNSGVHRGDNTSLGADADVTAVSNQGARLLIIVDQFEEVFTLGNEARRNEFVGWLFELVQERGVLAFLTIRDDYVNEVRRLPEKYSSWIIHEDARVLVETLSLTELRSAIEKPAEKVGLRFGDGIVDDLAGKVLGQIAGLPLLQFTLLRLWDNLDHNRITKEDYDKVGDPLTSLQKCADEFYKNLIPQDKKLVEQIFVRRLVNIEEGKEATSKRTKLTDVFELDDPAPPEDIARILAKMICKKRLIKLSGVQSAPCASTDPDNAHELLALARQQNQNSVPQIEVAHEALIRNWGLLGDWLVEERKNRRPRWDLEWAAKDWEKRGRPDAALYTEHQLSNLRGYQPSSGTPQYEFIVNSRQFRARQGEEEQKRESRERRLKWALAISCAIALSCLAALLLRAQYTSSREFAYLAAGLLSRQAEQVMMSDRPLGLLLSVEALEKASEGSVPLFDLLFGINVPGSIGRSLRDALGNTAPVVLPGLPESGTVESVSFSPNRQWVAAASRVDDYHCVVNLWHVDVSQTLTPTLKWYFPEHDCTSPVNMVQVQFDQNSGRLAVLQTNGAMDIVSLDAEAQNLQHRATNLLDGYGVQSSPLQAIALSQTWRWFATSDESGKLNLHEIDPSLVGLIGSRPLNTDNNGCVRAVFSPDEHWLACIDIEGTLRLWNLSAVTSQPFSQSLPMRGDELAFDPNGHWVAVASRSGFNVWLQDLQKLDEPDSAYVLPGKNYGEAVSSLAFKQGVDIDATFLAVGYESGTILIWDVAHLEFATSDIPTPSGAATQTRGQLVSIPEEIRAHSKPVNQLVFNASTKNRLISASEDLTARIYDVSRDGHELVGTLYGSGRTFQNVIFGADGVNQVIAIQGSMMQLWQGTEASSNPSPFAEACWRAGRYLTAQEKDEYLVKDEGYLSVCERLQPLQTVTVRPKEESK